MPWQQITSVEQCPPGNGLEVVVGERIVALFNVNGNFFALDGVCPHQGGPLAEGEISGCIVTCPWHGWQFDVRTGHHQLHRTMIQPRFETKVEAGSVWVDVPE
jgi:nitrite reductase (NADH) small subunit